MSEVNNMSSTNDVNDVNRNKIEVMESNLFSLTANLFSLKDPDVYLTDMRRISLIDNHGKFLTTNKRQEIWERESWIYCKNNNFNYWIIVMADGWKDKKKDGSDIDPINIKGMNVQPFTHCLGFIDMDMIAKNIRNHVNEINEKNKEKNKGKNEEKNKEKNKNNEFLKITCFDEFRMINDRVLDEKRRELMGNKSESNGENGIGSCYVNSIDNCYANSTNSYYVNNIDSYRLARVVVFKKKWIEIE